MRFKAQDLMSWLRHVDVNGLTDMEAEEIAHVDIEDDAQLDALVLNWLRPRFLEMNDQNQREFRGILDQSDAFNPAEVRTVFAQVVTPSGQSIRDIPRFLEALKKAASE